MIRDLNIAEDDDGICFSYTPLEENQIHNANMLGVSLLARTYSYTDNKEFLNFCKPALKFSLNKQNTDGSWNYSIDLNTGEYKIQHDWHQGFIIDSIFYRSSCWP